METVAASASTPHEMPLVCQGFNFILFVITGYQSIRESNPANTGWWWREAEDHVQLAGDNTGCER